MNNNPSQPLPEQEEVTAEERRAAARKRYGEIAAESAACCGGSDSTACCDSTASSSNELSNQSRLMGYTDADLQTVDTSANLGLGCGNPKAIAGLTTGETVLDLGSGAGFDCLLAAEEVGPSGQVIGVDMTPEMIEQARENIQKNNATNVEFRLGEIEHLPVSDSSIDVVISNCVINLSPNKSQVFREAYRVLRPGGRLAISDVVATASIPEDLRADPESLASCVSGAAPIPDLESMLRDAGFVDIVIEPKDDSDEFIREWDDEWDLNEFLKAVIIQAQKPSE